MLNGTVTPQDGYRLHPSPSHPANADEPMSWEMIGLGLEEPLPSQDIINDL